MKNILKGKALEDFEKWYLIWVFKEKTYLSLRFSDEQILKNWKSLHISEQYGVLEDWFDSVGVYISIEHNEISRMFGYCISTKPVRDDIYSRHEFQRNEARIEAIKKGVEIYNSMTNG